MITSEFLNEERRTVYVRALLREIVDVYHVHSATFAKAIEFHPQYVREVYRGERQMRHRNLTKLENGILDLYEPLLRDDFPNNKEELERFVDLLMR